MFRVFMLYDERPDAARYAQHAELCRRVNGATFRHGEVFGAPRGEPEFRYYAEFELPDRAAFEAALQTEELAATGRDAREMGAAPRVMFAEVS